MLPDDGGRSERAFVHDPVAYGVLAESLGVTAEALEAEIEERRAFLEELAARGICDPVSVALAVRDYPEPPAQPEERPA
jgi:hypothetical protein